MMSLRKLTMSKKLAGKFVPFQAITGDSGQPFLIANDVVGCRLTQLDNPICADAHCHFTT